jgi:hypothetical protein
MRQSYFPDKTGSSDQSDQNTKRNILAKSQPFFAKFGSKIYIDKRHYSN